jgi:glycosyltransferase involved in cell wall biosynthesis
MKIAYVYDAAYPWVKGGAERRIYELSRRLARRGHEIHGYCMKWWEGDKNILDEGVYLHGICKPMELYSGERRSIKEAAYFASKVLSIDDGFDIIDCQNFPYLPCFSTKLLCSLNGQELFITWHEVWGDYWREYLGRKGVVGRSIEWAASRLTDKNIAVSDRTRRGLEDLGAKSVQVVPNGIDFRGIERVPASERQSDIIYVGRLARHKNVEMLIQAVSLVARDRPKIRAMIIGDGPDIEKLKAQALRLGLETTMEFTGFLQSSDEAIALMKSSKIFVSPSTREGFGMAALEANACGLPVVTVNHRLNAVCDLITGETGLLCEASAESLAEAIIIGLDSGNDKRKRCVERSKSYEWDKICDLAETVYLAGMEGVE